MTKYKTLITTQYLENYGAHSENGKFEDGNAYWKFKGGEQYVISTNSHKEANAVAFMSAYLQKDNDNCRGKELITSWEMLPTDWVEEDLIVEGQEEFFRAPFYIDVEEYFELQKRVNKKRKAGGKISVDRSPAGMITASLAKAING
jgi:hypothetical protein